MLNSQEKPAAEWKHDKAPYLHTRLCISKVKRSGDGAFFCKILNQLSAQNEGFFCNFTCGNSTHFFNIRHDKNTT